MKLKLIACFLLFLFSIVIAFPGYSNGAASTKLRITSTIKTTQKADISWKLLLKKCLSKGINLIEEERTIEEDELAQHGCVFYHNGIGQIGAVHLPGHCIGICYALSETEQLLNTVFSPPEPYRA